MKKLLLLLFLSPYAFAGQGKGGGDVVVCYNKKNEIVKMQAYDFWNASRKFNLNIQERIEENYMDKIKENLKRLRKIDPVFADHLLKYSEIFAPENINYANEEVGLVPFIGSNGDGVQTILPGSNNSECHKQTLERIAEFSANPLPFEKPFRLTKHLWEAADNTTKYAIVQHELIYREFKRVLKEQDSEKAQLYNAYISSKEFDITPMNYFNFLRGLKLESLSSFSIKIDNLSFAAKRFRLYSDGVYGGALFGKQHEQVTTYEYQGQELDINSIFFYPSGKVRNMILNQSAVLNINGVDLKVRDEINFSEDGLVTQALLDGWQEVELKGRVYNITAKLHFYESGNIKSIYTPVCSRYFKFDGRRFRMDEKYAEYYIYFTDEENPKINKAKYWYGEDDNFCYR